ncbi:MAG: hypothetical protein CM15mP55_1430 [Hyphomicrobiales bacterium]|nr:MAG: hypothetical protein CM15mP55_1430 [Hyphomicrobiales bacterium]
MAAMVARRRCHCRMRGRLNTLIDYRYQQHFKAGTGTHGMGATAPVPTAPKKVLRVPIGTQIFAEDNETLLADLTEIGQRIVLARGGNGGFGNARFKGAGQSRAAPCQSGLEGRDAWLWLRLKLIADIGLLGCPMPANQHCLPVSAARAENC